MLQKFSLLLLSLFLSSQVFAANAVKAPHLWVRLISEKSAVEPGKILSLGIHFVLDPEWHVYWQNPGDSGEAPRFQWNLSSGFKLKNTLWPLPEKIIVGPLADFGYSKEVLFISDFSTPSKLNGDTTTIKVQVKWLVCQKVCVPGKADLDLTLPTKKVALYTTSKEIFSDARSRIPHSLRSQQVITIESKKDFFELTSEGFKSPKNVEFFPQESLKIDNPSKQKLEILDNNHFRLEVKKSEGLLKEPNELAGVIKVDDQGYSFKSSVISTIQNESGASSSKNIFVMLFFAFIGGIILNLMPCVFPVLSMKVFAFLKMAHDERKKIKIHSIVYTLGILVSFWILVGSLLILKSQGEKLGWGFQLQSPAFVSTLCSILFLFGLSLVGVFEIGSSIVGVGGSLTRSEGLMGAFFTGVLATIVSTPCTAPFMGSAVGFALSQSPIVTFLIFTSLALGLAFPYVAISLVPGLANYLPKPGRWMETLKQFTAFLIFATVVWLVSVIAVQTPPTFTSIILSSFLIISIAAWMLHRWPQNKIYRSTSYALIAGALLLTATQAPMASKMTIESGDTSGLKWEVFSPEKIQKYRDDGKNVFVDFTAAWCISCKVNELVVFKSTDVLNKIKEKSVVLMKADWTSHDAAITDTLAALGRSGVPAYAVYEKNKTTPPELLPEVITPGIVINAFNNLR